VSSIGPAGSGGVSLPAPVQSALNALSKVDQELTETIIAIASGQKARNPGLGMLVDLSV